MNFLCAIKHAAIGYGIRRKSWNDDVMLHLDNNNDLRWINRKDRTPQDESIARLLGPDQTGDITAEDIKATDWEAI